jgi:hypothetical protein
MTVLSPKHLALLGFAAAFIAAMELAHSRDAQRPTSGARVAEQIDALGTYDLDRLLDRMQQPRP